MLRRTIVALGGKTPSTTSFSVRNGSPNVTGWKGVDFLRNRFTNKGTAFTEAERDHLGVRGLLPPAVEQMNDQLDRYWAQFNLLKEPINRYQLLRSIMDNNITLYYALVIRHIRQTLPIIYTPTVGEACQRYGALYQKDHGVYVTSKDVGHVKEVLANTRKRQIDMIVVTDGSRILGLGDLGSNGMGISIGKCSLYVAGAGIHPGRVLPVMIDVGTNNETLKNDPLYLGQRVSRICDEEFYGLMDEFMQAVKELWPTATVQFEDFSNNHCFDMLARYQSKYRCFNDDIQGTGAVVSAGFVNAMLKSGIPPKDHRLLVYGAGSASAGVARSIVDLVATKFDLPPEEVKNMIYFFDKNGLVTSTRCDDLPAFKKEWMRHDVTAEQTAKLTNFIDAVKFVKPTALFGLAGVGPAFTKEMVEFMCTYCASPILFPLSNPTSKAEIVPSDAYAWSKGTAIVASGSPFPECVINGVTLKPSQGNNMYVFPGIGLGCAIAQPTHIPNSVIVTAAKKLTDMTSPQLLHEQGMLFPPIEEIRNVSRHVALAVIQHCQQLGIATAPNLSQYVPDLLKTIDARMWDPTYPPDRVYLESGPAGAAGATVSVITKAGGGGEAGAAKARAARSASRSGGRGGGVTGRSTIKKAAAAATRKARK